MSISRSNCTNGVVRSMGYWTCCEKERECSCDEVFEKFGGKVMNDEVRRRAGLEM